jgi:hypothetical protein
MDKVITKYMNKEMDNLDCAEINATLALITETFLELLKEENSCYKYSVSYLEYLEYFQHLQINDYNMVDHLVKCCNIIKSEWGKCRAHNPNEGSFEVKIFGLIKNLLLPFLDEKYEEYVRLLKKEQHVNYPLTYDSQHLIEWNPCFNFIKEETMVKNSKEHVHYITNNLYELFMLQDLNRLTRIEHVSPVIIETQRLYNFYNCISNHYINSLLDESFNKK